MHAKQHRSRNPIHIRLDSSKIIATPLYKNTRFYNDNSSKLDLDFTPRDCTVHRLDHRLCISQGRKSFNKRSCQHCISEYCIICNTWSDMTISNNSQWSMNILFVSAIWVNIIHFEIHYIYFSAVVQCKYFHHTYTCIDCRLVAFHGNVIFWQRGGVGVRFDIQTVSSVHCLGLPAAPWPKV